MFINIMLTYTKLLSNCLLWYYIYSNTKLYYYTTILSHFNLSNIRLDDTK